MVYIDGKPHKMELIEGNAYTGTYQYKTTLEQETTITTSLLLRPATQFGFRPIQVFGDKAKRSRSSTDLSSRCKTNYSYYLRASNYE